jgi:hypothetical protein
VLWYFIECSFQSSYIGCGWASSLHLQAIWHTFNMTHIPISEGILTDGVSRQCSQNSCRNPSGLRQTKWLFPGEFSFEDAWIVESVRLRLFDSFQVKVLFNLLLTTPIERQNRKIEKQCVFLNTWKRGNRIIIINTIICTIIILLLLFRISFMHSIYNYIPERNHISSVKCSFAVILYLQIYTTWMIIITIINIILLPQTNHVSKVQT